MFLSSVVWVTASSSSVKWSASSVWVTTLSQRPPSVSASSSTRVLSSSESLASSALPFSAMLAPLPLLMTVLALLLLLLLMLFGSLMKSSRRVESEKPSSGNSGYQTFYKIPFLLIFQHCHQT